MDINNTDLLIKIETITNNHKYAVVKNRKAYTLIDMKNISINDILYYNMPKDGIYIISESTCDGICKIGEPHKDCISRKIFSDNKCSKYSFSELDNIYLSYDDLESIVNMNA